MNWPEEKLLYQAEQAATKCGLCGRYGDHYMKDCPTLQPLLTRAESRESNLGLNLFWYVLGFCVGVLVTLLWKGLTR
jgi:hypothetical protein